MGVGGGGSPWGGGGGGKKQAVDRDQRCKAGGGPNDLHGWQLSSVA